MGQCHLQAHFAVAAHGGLEWNVVHVAVVLRVEDARVAGVGSERRRDVVDHTQVGRHLVLHFLPRRDTGKCSAGVMVLLLAGPARDACAGQQRQWFGQPPAGRGIQAGLLHQGVVAGASLADGRFGGAAVPGMDVGNVMAPAGRAGKGIALADGAGAAHPHGQVVFPAAQMQLAGQVGVQAVSGLARFPGIGIQGDTAAGNLVDEGCIGRCGPIAVGDQAVGLAGGMVQVGLECPVVIDLVAERRECRARAALPACPGWREAGGNRQVGQRAVGVEARDGPPDGRLGRVLLALVAHGNFGGRPQIRFHHTQESQLVLFVALVEAVLFLRRQHEAAAHRAIRGDGHVHVGHCAVVVPAPGADVHGATQLAGGTLSDQVDRGRWRAHPGEDTVGAAYQVHPFVECGVVFLVGFAAVAGHAVDLEILDHEAPGVIERSLGVVERGHHTRHVPQHGIHTGQRFIVHLLAGGDAD